MWMDFQWQIDHSKQTLWQCYQCKWTLSYTLTNPNGLCKNFINSNDFQLQTNQFIGLCNNHTISKGLEITIKAIQLDIITI
jgi:hypothetical protein